MFGLKNSLIWAFILMQLPVICLATTLSFESGAFMTLDSEMTSDDAIILTVKTTLNGSGFLKAPRITINTATFEFKGTIECDQECIITTQKPFDHRLFTQKGKGKFIFVVDPELGTKNEASAFNPRFAQSSNTLKIQDFTFYISGPTQETLINAIKKNDLKKFLEILETAKDFQQNADDLTILLIIAGLHDAFSIAQELIARGAPVNKSINNSSSHPLLAAIVTKNTKFAQMLIEAGANVNEADNYLQTPLHRAVHNDDLEMVELLLKTKDINVNASDIEWRTPLMIACYKGNAQIVETLMNNKAYPFKKDMRRCMASDYALTNNHKHLLNILHKQFVSEQKKNEMSIPVPINDFELVPSVHDKQESSEQKQQEKHADKSIFTEIKDDFRHSSWQTKIWSIAMIALVGYFIVDDMSNRRRI